MPLSLAFGPREIAAGPSTPLSSTVTNSGTQSVTITGVTVGGSNAAHFERLTGVPSDCVPGKVLTSGQTCVVRARFDPAVVGALSAAITITSNAPPISVALTGTGISTQLSRTPATLAFAPREIAAGPSTPLSSTVTNSGTQSVTISGVTVGGTHAAHFGRLTGAPSDCVPGKVLASAQTCVVRARFDPAVVGALSAAITITSNAPPISVALTGTGISTQLSRTPATLAFAPREIAAGPSTPLSSTVTNSGTQPVTITSVTVGGTHAAHLGG